MDDEIRQIISDKLISINKSLDEQLTQLQNIVIEIKTLTHTIDNNKKLDDFFTKSDKNIIITDTSNKIHPGA
ncbi:hypothetical protein ES707_14227 [subsurface metagenome]